MVIKLDQSLFYLNCIVVFFLAFNQSILGQQVTISGYVTDESSGEVLIGADVYLTELPEVGVSTNSYGFYSLTIDSVGSIEISAAYLGYQIFKKRVYIDKNVTINFELSQGLTLKEVVIKGENDLEDVQSTDMGRVNLSTKTLKTLPALMGEVDVMKTLQLLPGVSSASEGANGFSVRGGGAEQNLVLLDEAIVYNASHLLGFFSVFNSDIIKSTELIKGSIPAEYGGRLSSVIDINSIDGNKKNYEFQGGIGLISSRLTVQGPIVKDKASFVLGGRRTYLMDLVQPFLKGGDFEGTNYYFYDMNAKINYHISDKDRLFFSSYIGRDKFNFNSEANGFAFQMPYGNTTASFRWNRIVHPKMFVNTSLIYNEYRFKFSAEEEDFFVKNTSGINDFTFKQRWEYQASIHHTLTFGAEVTYHIMKPSQIEAESEDVNFGNNLLPKRAISYGLFISDLWKVSDRLQLEYGSRLSMFTQLGDYTSATGRIYKKNEIVKTYILPEPRISSRYLLGSNNSIKAGISYTVQYLHLVSNSSSTLPLDVWVPSTERVRPQTGIQYAAGYVHSLQSGMFQVTVEAYYRDLWSQLDYRDTYVSNVTTEIENEFVFGRGRAYGIEFLLEKKKGSLRGWIAYTLSRSEREFPDIENGRVYPSVFDKPHDLSCVLQYELNDRWLLSSTFVLASGRWFTAIEGFYSIEGKPIAYYEPRNSSRLDTYHRLDLSLVYDPGEKVNKKWHSTWNFSIYNVYNIKNPAFIYSDVKSDGQSFEVKSYKLALYPIIPAITWNFNFN